MIQATNQHCHGRNAQALQNRSRSPSWSVVRQSLDQKQTASANSWPGAPHGGLSGQGLAARALPTPSQEQAAGSTRAAPAPGTSLGMGTGHGPVGGPRLVGPVAGQGRGELETCPAVVSVGQGLMASGTDMGCWAVGEPRGARQGQSGLVVPPGPWHQIFVSNRCSRTLFSHLDTLRVFCCVSLSTP